MHVFCAACYSGWMERSPLCPTCRCPVERIRKNHILNNLVEAYLIQHPGRPAQSAFWPLNSQEERRFCSKNNPICWFLCVRRREVPQWGGPEEHGQPEQDYSGHVAAEGGALLLRWGGQLGLPAGILRQRQRLLRHEVWPQFWCLHYMFTTRFFFKKKTFFRLSFLSTVSQFWCAGSVLATRQMSASCCLLRDPATGFLVCQLQLLCLLPPNQQRQRAVPKPQGSSPQPPPTGPQVMPNICTWSFSLIHCWNSKNGSGAVIKSLHINSSHVPFCSVPERSSPRVLLPPSGHPPHLHLLPPADARQTGRAQQPAGRPAMWVVPQAVNSANSAAGIRYLVFNLGHLFGRRAFPNSAAPASAVLLFMCGEIIV